MSSSYDSSEESGAEIGVKLVAGVIGLAVLGGISYCEARPAELPDLSHGKSCISIEENRDLILKNINADVCAWVQIDPQTRQARGYAEVRSMGRTHTKRGSYRSRSGSDIRVRIDRVELLRGDTDLVQPASSAEQKTSTAILPTDWAPYPGNSNTVRTYVMATIWDEEGNPHVEAIESEPVNMSQVIRDATQAITMPAADTRSLSSLA